MFLDERVAKGCLAVRRSVRERDKVWEDRNGRLMGVLGRVKKERKHTEANRRDIRREDDEEPLPLLQSWRR